MGQKGTISPARSHRPFDSWFRLPGAFGGEELGRAVDTVETPPGATLIDPFLGSGRAATFVVGRGDPVIGMESHPLLSRLAKTKLTRPGPPSELVQHCQQILEQAERLHPDQDPAGEAEYLQKMVSARELVALCALREAIRASSSPWDDHLCLLALGALRAQAPSGWPYPAQGSPAKRNKVGLADLVLRGAQEMSRDLAGAPREPTAVLIEGDARLAKSWRRVPHDAAQGCVSSPPYLNQLSYAEATRLELTYLGWIKSWSEMTQLVSDRLIASCTQQVNKTRWAQAKLRLQRFPVVNQELEDLRSALRRQQKERRRGKPYDRLLDIYLADLAAVLGNLERALVPGARLAWILGDSAPYGVPIDTPGLVSRLAKEIGYRQLDDIALRERGHRWNGVGARHNQQLSERMIVFQARASRRRHTAKASYRRSSSLAKSG